MLIVGLTGGVSTGKTTALRYFKKTGAGIISADGLVQSLYKKKSVRKKLANAFGEEILTRSGSINRKKLGEKVFSNKRLLKKLNSLVHPLVRLETGRKIIQFKSKSNNRKKLLVVEVPLLFETNSEKKFSKIIVIKSTLKKQISRLKKKGFSRADAIRRIRSQQPLRKKVKKADFVINNNKSNGELEVEVKRVYAKLVF